ncbi:PEPxxWA-CTERM sorting domain-containing protein [Sphingomonas sp. CL5.1]|uniref:PEPxxWA-CTERM sorting domain-containing protein n=1 Tax=Sphingomonas sp. CL5.1 TaxID=2653203 RepID=UPI0020C6C251|nr:PEPxxWA-CTERM sorting domain-containing protein [Sphingomonas sp. CL5.1]
MLRKMRKIAPAIGALAVASLFSTAASAHMVTFGWKETSAGTVLYAEHWHGDLSAPYSDNGGLHITDTATSNTITVQWAGVINNTVVGDLGLTGYVADSVNAGSGTYNDWMFTSAIPLGNGIYDFFTGTNCCIDTMGDPERVTITGITTQPPGIGGSVPEPATWALMIMGFGAVGGAMRVRRRAVNFAA